jgi:hypothetical protein
LFRHVPRARHGSIPEVGWSNEVRNDREQREPAVYIFVIKSKICYVGKSEGIQGRMAQYERGMLRGSRKVDTGISRAIINKDKVSVYTLSIPRDQQFFERKGLPVDYVSGVEWALIKRVKPEWNGSQKKAGASSHRERLTRFEDAPCAPVPRGTNLLTKC